MPYTFNHLRGYVGGCSAICVGPITLGGAEFFCESEINELYMTVGAKHHVLRLQVSVNDIFA